MYQFQVVAVNSEEDQLPLRTEVELESANKQKQKQKQKPTGTTPDKYRASSTKQTSSLAKPSLNVNYGQRRVF